MNNLSFEQVGNDLIPSWDFGSFGYKYETQKSNEGNYLSLKAEPEFVPGSLFRGKPDPAEVISKDVGNGIVCSFPILLFLETDKPDEMSEAFKSLRSEMIMEAPLETDGTNEIDTRLPKIFYLILKK